MANPKKQPSAINVNIDTKEIYKILCPECKAKVREVTRSKIKEQLLDSMVEEMTDQALSQVLPEEEETPPTKPPKRVLRSKREIRSVQR